MRTLSSWATVAMTGLGILAGCSTEPTGPVAGALSVTLATPHDDDGAVLFTISGGSVDSVESAGYSLYSARIDPTTLRVIATGDLRTGAIARIYIPDSRQVSRYSVAVNQVALRSTYGQRDPTGYSIALGP
jgi:hypothetical protein